MQSCDALFEKELPKHLMSLDNAITNQTTAESSLLGAYSYFGEFGTLSAYYLIDDAYRCGLLKGTYRGQDFEKKLELLDLPPEHSELLAKWTICGKMVNAVNHLLVNIANVDESRFSPNRKQEIIAEARCVRAFAQLYLMKHYSFFWDIESEFGPLMRREPGTLANNNKKRSGVRESYEMILDDLNFAIEYAPDCKNVYQMSKELAMAYKIETLLLRGQISDFNEAILLSDQLLASPNCAMEDTFADVFKNGYTSKELLFSRFLSQTKLNDVDSNVASIKKMMCGKYQPNDAYYDIINAENDKRFAYTFDSTVYEKYDANRKILILKKLWREDGNCPMMYMRLAQVKLFKAEALLHKNASVAEVLAPLNELRVRAGNEPLDAADFLDRDDLVKVLFNENVREIGLENGSEWFLAVRLKSNDGRRLLREFNAIYQDDRQMAWQIPLNETSYNSFMKPNPVFIAN